MIVKEGRKETRGERKEEMARETRWMIVKEERRRLRQKGRRS
jgi:hypothetical protein